jgi:hypothetical protein
VAFCYHREGNDTKVIEFTSKVIERTPYISDIQVMIKALTRRGLCYLSSEKYKKAADDLSRV